MHTPYCDLASELAELIPSRKTVVTAVAYCLVIVSMIVFAEFLHQREISEVQAMLKDKNWDFVERKLEGIRDRAFCNNLVGRRDVYHAQIADHNEIVQLYNASIAPDTVDERFTPFKSTMKVTPITREDITSMAMMARINPWDYCYSRYGITARR